MRIAQEGAKVTLVDAMLGQYGGNLANIAGFEDQVDVNCSDIRDSHSLDLLVSGVDVIYNMAGQTSHIDSMNDPFTDLDINCASQLSILECCRKFNPEVEILYASTRQIYGRPQYLPVDEKHPIQPVDVNGINKYAAEMYLKLYHEVYGLKCTSLRLTNTYGPRQYVRDDKHGFVGLFIRLALAGQPIKIFGDGKQLRDFNYVDDVVQAFITATGDNKLYGGAYNLGHPDTHSLLEFVETLSKHANFTYEIIPFPEDMKAIDIGDYCGNFDFFSSLVGWKPKVRLEEGLGKTLEYFAEHGCKYMALDD